MKGVKIVEVNTDNGNVEFTEFKDLIKDANGKFASYIYSMKDEVIKNEIINNITKGIAKLDNKARKELIKKLMDELLD